MSNIEKIRQEIERLMKETEDSQFDKGERYGLKIVLEFIDSLPEETCKDSLQVPETCKENTDSFTSLEEAAARYERENRESILSSVDIVDAFIAGAEWQKKQMELDGIVTLTESDFDAEKGKASEWGYNLCKKQMMKDAVEGEIGYWNQRGLSIRLDQSLEKLGYNEDTEVKIIIVKKEE